MHGGMSAVGKALDGRRCLVQSALISKRTFRRGFSVVKRLQTRPQHHASTEMVLDIAERQKQRLLRLGLAEVPFALVTGNTIECAATLQAAAELRCSVVLMPSLLLAPLAVKHAGVHCLVDHDDAGEPVVLNKYDSVAESRPWQDSMSKLGNDNSSGACVVATSGSGQAGPKLVAYRWSSCKLQARVTADRTLRDSVPGGGRVRFIAASNIGHAYNLNGMFSALSGKAELCVPKNSSELVQTLLTPPPEDVEATVLFATPMMYRMLLREDPVLTGGLSKSLPISSLHCFSAGCPLPETTYKELERLLGIRALQNYGSSETGNIALEDLAAPSVCSSGIPWGRVELRPAMGGRLLPEGAEGEICVAVPWASDGYLREHELIPHQDAPFFRTGDAGRWIRVPTTGMQHLVVMQRLRPPLRVNRAPLSLLLQPYEVESAILAANPSATAAAALQGPNSTLYCAVEGSSIDVAMGGPIQPDRLLRLDHLPTSPAGKVLYSKIIDLFDTSDH